MNTALELADVSVVNSTSTPQITPIIEGQQFEIGTGFQALAFRDAAFMGKMDPLVMVDHYKMSEPTFGAHPHAGLSAVSIIFEDSEGALHNRDSLGNDFDLMPGDLYWLKAGSGIVHDESPRQGSIIHGLQVFVYLPSAERLSNPASLHVRAEDIPLIKEPGVRVRVILGESKGLNDAESPASPMRILDGFLGSHYSFNQQLATLENAWIYAVDGDLEFMAGNQQRLLTSGQAVAISNLSPDQECEVQLYNREDNQAHFVLFSAKPFEEDYVQKGPFIMGSHQEIAQIEANYNEGKLGSLR